MVKAPRTPKERAQAYAHSVWGSEARIGKDKLGRYLIGVRESGFLGEGIRYYGAGATWEEALEDARAATTRKSDMRARGWTNSPLA